MVVVFVVGIVGSVLVDLTTDPIAAQDRSSIRQPPHLLAESQDNFLPMAIERLRPRMEMQ